MIVCAYVCLEFIYNSCSSAGMLLALAVSPRSPAPVLWLMRHG